MKAAIGWSRAISFITGLILFAVVSAYPVLAGSDTKDPRYEPIYQPYLKSEGQLGNIVIDTKKNEMAKAKVKPVVFPHWFHRIRFKCKICHEEIFIMEKGANDINMGAIIGGEFCGACHNGYIAFAPVECVRCHSYEPEKEINAP
ncbi:MAG: c(7)-type cytochrome triheme domain-containing protein [Thermodesulfobacteriota bacterium]